MKTFEIELTGSTPLLHHKMSEETLMSLLGSKSRKKKVKAEKSPREIAEEAAYKTQGGEYCIPMGYIIGAFKYAAAEYKQTSSKKSYKAIAGGIFRPKEQYALLTDKEDEPILDFEVDIQKATNHQAGAVAVCRPRFDEWKTKFNIEIDDSLIDPAMAQQILEDAGKRSGIGSFRVSKGGYYGQFSVTSFQPLKD